MREPIEGYDGIRGYLNRVCKEREVRVLEKDYAALERKLKIAEEALIEVLSNSCGYPDDNEDIIEQALSAIKEE